LLLWSGIVAAQCGTTEDTTSASVEDGGNRQQGGEGGVEASGSAGRDAASAGASDRSDGGDAVADSGQPAIGDDDRDGLSNEDERLLGTSPGRYDSDDDGWGDLYEVEDPASPADRDGDGVIDALESWWLDSDQDGVWDPIDPSDGWQIVGGGFSPRVIRNDGRDSARFDLQLTNAEGLDKVQIGLEPVGCCYPGEYELSVVGEVAPVDRVELFDDGTHGDILAGDRVYSRDGFVTNAPIVRPDRVRGIKRLNALYVTMDGIEQQYLLWVENEQGFMVANGAFGIGILDTTVQTAIHSVSESIQTTAHVINAVDPELAGLVRLAVNGPAPTSEKSLSAALLQGLGDFGEQANAQMDFLYVMAEHPSFGLYGGKSHHVSNQISGIGVDLASPMSEAPKLQATVALGFNSDLPLNHETAHRWAVDLDESFGFGEGHWGYAGTDGVLGGFDPDSLVDNGDGTYTVGSFDPAQSILGAPFSDIELYLMGLVPPEQVAPIPVLHDVQEVASNDNDLTVTYNATLETVTIDDIIAVQGNRNPTVEDSQKQFQAVFVVFSEQLLTDTELAYFDGPAMEFGLQASSGPFTFYKATGGRATMTTTLP
jgi:hypothetical protein